MRPDMDQSLLVEYDELFALKDRLGAVADQVRARLVAVGLSDRFEAEIFDGELELRGTEGSPLLIRLDSFRLEITGAPPDLQVQLLAAILLDEAGVFRLTMVESGYALTMKTSSRHRLHLIDSAFTPVETTGEPMLDRQFSMTWDWGNATTGYSLQVSDREDRELFVSFKARVGYMSLPELQSGVWMTEQAHRFDEAVARLLIHLGWAP